jgi:hypothetical protein
MFNNHDHCGAWCNRLPKTDNEKKECEWRFKSKEKDAKPYEQCLTIHRKFTVESSLMKVLHEHDTQKNESMNDFIRGWVPKDSHYARTTNWEGRVMTAVGVDSVGYEVYYRRASWRLGLSLTREGLLGRIRKERAKTTYRKYRKISDVKRTMAVRRHSKIIEELKKEHADFLKGKTYATNISGPGGEQTGGGGVIAIDECPFCGLKGHKTKNSTRCLYSTNPSSKFYSSDNRAAVVFISGEGE